MVNLVEVAEGTVGERCVEAAKFDASGTSLAVVSSRPFGNIWDGEIRLFDVKEENPSCVALVHGCATTLKCSFSDIVWITDKRTLAVSGDDGNIYVFSIEKATTAPLDELVLQSTFADHEDVVSGLAFDKTHRRMLSASLDGLIKSWDITRPDTPLKNFVADYDALQPTLVWDVMTAQHQEWFASAHQDGSIRIWDPRSSEERASQTVGMGGLGAALALSDGVVDNKLAVSHENGYVSTLDVRKLGAFLLASETPVHTGSSCDVQLFKSGSSTFAVSGGQDGKVIAFDTSNQGVVSNTSLVSHSDYVRALSTRPAAPDRPLQVLSGGFDGLVKLFNVTNLNE